MCVRRSLGAVRMDLLMISPLGEWTRSSVVSPFTALP